MPERFSASNVEKFIACHASANLDLAIPGWAPPIKDPLADNAANRGTRMHEIMAELMTLAIGDAKKFSEALTYIAEVRSRRRFTTLIEHPVTADWLSTRPVTTADLVLHTKDEMHIIDLKTGKIPVSVVNNDQLLFYAASYGPLAPSAKGVMLHIVQPWADNMESYFATAAEIQLFMDQAVLAEYDINQGDVTFSPGDHCLFCPANPHSRAAKGYPLCPVLMQMYYPTMPVDRSAILQEDLDE